MFLAKFKKKKKNQTNIRYNLYLTKVYKVKIKFKSSLKKLFTIFVISSFR